MIVGIDLGTTNSLVAVFEDGESKIIHNALGEAMTPSVVGLDDDGAVLVGRAARERLVTHPHLTAAAFKRYMGSNKVVRLGRTNFRPEELSALVLRSLVADAEAATGHRVTEAVITVPAYFGDAQRKATRAAGELAGLRVERLLNEPTAAALAYGLHQRDLERQFLVLDLGGGTFDVAILELFEGIMEVRASCGDSALGGEDFVDLMSRAFCEHHKLTNFQDDRALFNTVRAEAERAKRALSASNEAIMNVRRGETEYSWTLDGPAFATLSRPLLDRIRAPVEQALRDASVRARELDEVVLVGGATKMPVFRRLAATMLGRIPAAHLDPDRVVAIGAGVQAGLKARDAALEDVVLTDVAPFSLGTDVVRGENLEPGFFLPIIERNTTIPASRVERLFTVSKGQTFIEVGIYQGESRRVADNVHLGKLNIRVPPADKGEEAVDVRFTYDINGVLEVEVQSVTTGEGRRAVIEGNPGVLSAEEIASRLAALEKLKQHPRDAEENRVLLARAERLYETLLAERRQVVAEATSQFERALETQDPRTVRAAQSEFSQFLDSIEGESFL